MLAVPFVAPLFTVKFGVLIPSTSLGTRVLVMAPPSSVPLPESPDTVVGSSAGLTVTLMVNGLESCRETVKSSVDELSLRKYIT